MRRTVLVAAAASALLAGAAAPAPAQDAGGLSAARFAALDAVYVASLPLDGDPTPAQTAELRRVCEALDRGDRLLDSARTACLTSLEALPPSRAFARCTTRRRCLSSARRLRNVLNRTLAVARSSNRIVALELPPGACRAELRSSAALLRSLGALRDGLRLLQRGLGANDRTVIRRAERRIRAAGDALQDQPTAPQSLEIFRGVCAPSPSRATAASGRVRRNP